jgi:hypothetical protein
MIAVVLAFASLTIAIIWSIVFLPASFLGIRVYKISGIRMKKFLKTVKHSSIWTNDEPEGWVCGKGFLGFVQVVTGERNESRDLWLVCTKRFYEKHIQQKDEMDEGKSNKITYWVREGSFWRLNYNSRQLATPKRAVREKQAEAISSIIAKYDELKHVVCLLHGKAGGGKSMTVQYLCAELLKTKKGIHLCDTHAPYEHGDNFDSFYNKINPSEDSPLVLVFEEVDGLILNLHTNKIEQRQHNPVQIKNKTDWNSFLDKFDRDYYPHVILVMTTNKTATWFDDMDISYMREGRVDLKIEF